MTRYLLAVLVLLSAAVSQIEAATLSSGGGHIIQEDGSNLPTQPELNFTGTGVACANNSGAGSTDCTIDAAAAPLANYYVAGDSLKGRILYADSRIWMTCKLPNAGGNCLALDGTNDHLAGTDDTDLEMATAASFIIGFMPRTYSMTAAGGAMALVSKDDNNGYYVLMGSDGKVCIFINITGNANNFLCSATALTLDNWHLIGITSTSSATTIYIDGLLDSTSTAVTWTASYDNDSFGDVFVVGAIGQSGSAVTYYTAGALDEVQVYNAAISQSTYEGIYNSGNWSACGGSETNIVACWHLDSTSGTTATDSAGAAENLTLTTIASPPSRESGWRYCNISLPCLHFDNTNDYVQIHDSTDTDPGSGAFTISMIVNKMEGSTGYSNFGGVGKWNSGGVASSNEYGLFLSDIATGNTNNPDFSIEIGSTIYTASCSTALTLGTPAHLVGVRSGATMEIWLNGARCGTATPTTGAVNNVTGRQFMINGIWNSGGSHVPANARYQAVKFWKTALTRPPDNNCAGETPGVYTICDDYNTGTFIACTGSETNLAACWNLSDGNGSLVSQHKTITGIGSDSNLPCNTSGAPCLTIQAVLNNVPRFFAGNTTIHVASGVLQQETIVRGFNPAGDYYITFQGYYNPTPNSFTDVARYTGTSTGANTSAFPKVARSLFKNTGTSFTGLIEPESLLQITGGAGYCTAAAYDKRNWYRIEQVDSATALSVVTKWEDCGTPSATTTYNIFAEDDGSIIHGGSFSGYNGYGLRSARPGQTTNAKTYGIQVVESSGIRFRKLVVDAAYTHNMSIYAANVDEISASRMNGSAYVGLYIDVSNVNSVHALNTSQNNYEGMALIKHSSTTSVFASTFNRNGNGLAAYYGSQIMQGGVRFNLAKGNNLAGFDFEGAFGTYQFDANRSDSNTSTQIIISGQSNVNFTRGNTFTGGIRGIDISSSSNLSTEIISGTIADVEVLNATEVGILLQRVGICYSCEDFTMSGNTANFLVDASSIIYEYPTGFDIVMQAREIVKDSFLAGSTETGEVGELGWSFAGSGSVSQIGTAARPGIAQFNASVTGNAFGQLCVAACGTAMVTPTDTFQVEMIVNLSNLSSVTGNYRIGLQATAADSITNGIYFELCEAVQDDCATSAETTWFIVTENGGTESRATTGITVTTGVWYKLMIRRFNASTIYFYVDDVLVQSSSTNIPTVALQPMVAAEASTATAPQVQLDYFQAIINNLNR